MLESPKKIPPEGGIDSDVGSGVGSGVGSSVGSGLGSGLGSGGLVCSGRTFSLG
jgi:hypothetical protein